MDQSHVLGEVELGRHRPQYQQYRYKYRYSSLQHCLTYSHSKKFKRVRKFFAFRYGVISIIYDVHAVALSVLVMYISAIFM